MTVISRNFYIVVHSVEKYTKMLSRRKNFRQTTQQKSAKSDFANG